MPSFIKVSTNSAPPFFDNNVLTERIESVCNYPAAFGGGMISITALIA
jgi:hypothetical protein